jgi:hypothetical protein
MALQNVGRHRTWLDIVRLSPRHGSSASANITCRVVPRTSLTIAANYQHYPINFNTMKYEIIHSLFPDILLRP